MEQKIDTLRAEMLGHWELDKERFAKVDGRLISAEALRIEQKSDAGKEIAAALSAAKELSASLATSSEKAIGKTEEAVTKQIDALATRLDDLRTATDATIAALRAELAKVQAVTG